MSTQFSLPALSPEACLGYIRVSTDRQDLSVEAQTADLKREAEYQRLPYPEVFADPDTSGKLEFARRPDGARLLARVRELHQQGRGCNILITKVDRLARDTIDTSQTVRTLEALGARMIFLDLKVDTRTPMGRAFMQIAAIFAELELSRIHERIATAFAQKRSRNELCGTEPYGWTAVPTGETRVSGKRTVEIKRLESNPEEQKWLLFMDNLRRQGLGYHSIAKRLNDLGVPTKRRGEVLNLLHGGDTKASVEKKFTSGKWQAGNVAKVLTNQTTQDWLAAQAVQKAA